MANAWLQMNQTFLSNCINHVKMLLKHHISGVPEPFTQIEAPSISAEGEQHGLPAIENLRILFDLSPFETQVLVLCAAYELDSEVKALLAEVHGNPQMTYPTFGLTLACLPNSHWSALTPIAPLRKYQLIDLNINPQTALTTSPIRITERILHYLIGIFYLDTKLQGIIRPTQKTETPVPSHTQHIEKILSAYQSNKDKLPLIQLGGIDETGKHAIAQAALNTLGLNLWQIPAEHIPQNNNETLALAQLWTREATLLGAGLLITTEDSETQTQKNTQHLIEQITTPLFLTTKEPWKTNTNSISIQVDKPLKHEQKQLWQTNINQQQEDLTLQNTITALTSQFNLAATDIKTATTHATQQTRENQTLNENLWTSACAVSRPKIIDLAQQITPKATLNDLILPECEKQQIYEIIIHAAQRHKVYQEWGFENTSTRGLGLNALFSGPSGTGKTMAAEAIAHELHLDLFRIDLSAVINKYIGETEKNLNKLFNAAEDGGAILFFDEADALFGKRTETKDSHDRYANIEINYLLQKMENYRGITILATNLKDNLDPAFTRRLKFTINFPFPNEKNRLEIWQNIYPKQTPLDNINFTQLAKLNITGGNIRNIALYSAFLAANENTSVNMQHIKRATQIEYTKIEKPLTGNWQHENQH